MRSKVWTFLGLVYAEWASLVTGSFSAFLVLLGLTVSIASAAGAHIPSESIIQIATWTLAAICGGRAAFSVWEREHTERMKAVERLTPKLTAIYDPKKPPCQSVSEFRFSDGSSPTNGMVYRIEVENIGVEMINDCEGYLTEVAFENEAAELGVMNLLWAGIYPQALKVDLRPNVKRHLDLIIIYENGHVSIVSPGWPPNNRQNFFWRHGRYRFTVVIGGAGSTLPPYKIRLDYTGDWQTSTMEVMAS